MKKSALFAGLIVCLFVVGSAFAAGPQTPIPASLKKPAKTFVIAKSGSYYLAGNRLCDANGIDIEANNVTIDLSGFTLTGNNNGSGIYMRNRVNVEIRNGTISDFNYAIDDAYTYMGQNSSANHRVISIRALSNTQGGIKLYAPNSKVRDCLINGNGTSASGNNILGISVGDNSAVTGNTVSDTGDSAQSNATIYGVSAGNNCIITGNTINHNGYMAGANTAIYGIKNGIGSTITGNIVSDNGYSAGSVYGIMAATGSTVTGNTAYDNGSYATVMVNGIDASAGSIVTGNTAYQNGNGMSAVSGTVDGIFAGAGCSVIGNTAYLNGTSASGTVCGIYLTGNDFVNQNTAFNNGGTNMNDPGNCTFGQNHAP